MVTSDPTVGADYGRSVAIGGDFVAVGGDGSRIASLMGIPRNLVALCIRERDGLGMPVDLLSSICILPV